MTAKQQIITMIEDLPEDSTIDDIEYHLYVRKKVELALAALERGEVISHEEMKQRVESWKQN